MAKASELQSAARGREKCPTARTRDTLHCPLLPSPDGKGWGRDVTIRRLNPHDQMALTSRVVEAVQALSLEGETKEAFLDRYKVPELDTPKARESFFDNAWVLKMGCIDPELEIADAVAWLSNDDLDNIPVGDLAQWLLYHIRTLNEVQPGLEDVIPGLMTMSRLPGGLQMVERAVMQGGNAVELLLEGKVPQDQQEMAQFVAKWGGIISTVMVGIWRKQAKICADENASALINQLLDALTAIGVLKDEKASDEPE